MSEIKALDEMMDYVCEPGSNVNVKGANWVWVDTMQEYADRIEREIQERYMELPVDADGVPIHVHDILECHANGYHGTFTVFAAGKNIVVGNHDVEWVRDNPSKWFHIAPACTHVKPRTLEDVLREMVSMTDQPLCEEDILAFAAEIRELLGVDA